MAVNGLFTFEDLYAGKSSIYHHKSPPEITSLSTSYPILPVLKEPIITSTLVGPTSHFGKLISSTEIDSSTKLAKFVEVIPFTYFYWILLVLAVLLSLTLVIVFICYCRTFVKNYKARRGSIASFYRHRTTNRRIYANNIYQRTVPIPPPAPSPPLRSFPTPPCPSISLKSLDDQLYRRNSDVTHSPQIARHDMYLREPLSTFTSSNSTSNLSSALHSRLSARSSDPPLKVDQLYESQRASMALNDDTKNDSLILDIN